MKVKFEFLTWLLVNNWWTWKTILPLLSHCAGAKIVKSCCLVVQMEHLMFGILIIRDWGEHYHKICENFPLKFPPFSSSSSTSTKDSKSQPTASSSSSKHHSSSSAQADQSRSNLNSSGSSSSLLQSNSTGCKRLIKVFFTNPDELVHAIGSDWWQQQSKRHKFIRHELKEFLN